MPPLVSVVTPVRNGEAFIQDAVESILQQTLTDYEYIIVDHCSTDHTGEILQRLAAVDPRIQVIRQDTGDLSGARNTGWKAARGQYVAVQDADDISLATRLARQVAFLEEHRDIAVLGSAFQAMSSTGRLLPVTSAPLLTNDEIERSLPRGCPMAQPTVMIRRQALEAVGGYRVGFPAAADYELWMRLMENRFCFANLPDPLVYYRVHLNSISTAQLHDHTVGVLVIQAAAKYRREHGMDPSDCAEPLNAKVLQILGITPEMVDVAVAKAYRGRASNMLLHDDVESAVAILKQYEKDAIPQAIRRQLAAEFEFMWARVHFAQKHWAKGIKSAAKACLRDPRFFGALTGKAWRKIRPEV